MFLIFLLILTASSSTFVIGNKDLQHYSGPYNELEKNRLIISMYLGSQVGVIDDYGPRHLTTIPSQVYVHTFDYVCGCEKTGSIRLMIFESVVPNKLVLAYETQISLSSLICDGNVHSVLVTNSSLASGDYFLGMIGNVESCFSRTVDTYSYCIASDRSYNSNITIFNENEWRVAGEDSCLPELFQIAVTVGSGKQPCAPFCASCSSGSCEICASGYFLNENGNECVKTCADYGYLYNNGSIQECRSCDVGCTGCDDMNQCTACENGNVFLGDSCLPFDSFLLEIQNNLDVATQLVQNIQINIEKLVDSTLQNISNHIEAEILELQVYIDTAKTEIQNMKLSFETLLNSTLQNMSSYIDEEMLKMRNYIDIGVQSAKSYTLGKVVSLSNAINDAISNFESGIQSVRSYIDGEIVLLRNDLNETVREIYDEIGSLANVLDATIQNFESELASLREYVDGEIYRLEQLIGGHTTRFEDLESFVDELESGIEALSVSLNSKIDQLEVNMNNDLSTEVSKLTNKIEFVNNTIFSEITSFKIDVDVNFNNLLIEIEQVRNNLDANVSSLDQNIADLRKSHTKLSADVDDNEEDIDSLKTDTENLQKSVDDLEQENQNLENELNLLKFDMGKVHTELRSRITELEEMVESVDKKHSTTLDSLTPQANRGLYISVGGVILTVVITIIAILIVFIIVVIVLLSRCYGWKFPVWGTARNSQPRSRVPASSRNTKKIMELQPKPQGQPEKSETLFRRAQKSAELNANADGFLGISNGKKIAVELLEDEIVFGSRRIAYSKVFRVLKGDEGFIIVLRNKKILNIKISAGDSERFQQTLMGNLQELLDDITDLNDFKTGRKITKFPK